MMDRYEHIDHVFRDGLDQLEVNPDSNTWEHIAERMKANKRKRRMIYLSRAAAIFAFVITIVCGYLLSKNIQTNPQQSVVENTPVIEQPGQNNDTQNQEPAHTRQDKTNPESTKETGKKPDNEASNATASIPRTNGSTTQAGKTTATLNTGMDPVKEPVSLIDHTHDQPERKTISYPRLKGKESSIHDPGAPVLTNLPSTGKQDEQPIPVHEQTKQDQYLDKYTIEENKREKQKLKFQLSGVATPLYADVESRYNEGNDPASFMSADAGDPEVNKNALTAYTAGVKVSMSKGKRFSVQTGIMYARVDQLHQYEAFERITVGEESSSRNNSDQIIHQEASSRAPEQMGFEFSSAEDAEQSGENTDAIFDQHSLTITDQVEYLEVPVSMRYTVIDRKLGVNLMGGLATNFLVSGERETSTGSGINNASDISGNLDKVKYSTHVGIGFEYPVYKQLVFVLEPTVKYYMNSLESINQTKVDPFAFGLYTGVNFTF